MKKFFDCTLIGMQFKLKRTWENFVKEERGDSNFVAIIVLIVIIIAVAGIFRTQLTEAVTKVFENLTDFIG